VLSKLTRALVLGLVAVPILLVVAAKAQDSSRPVRVVVPFAPSGFPDRIARILTRYMSEDLQQRYYVENRPGAGGLVGSADVAGNAPDGMNYLISSLPSQVIAPLVSGKASFDPIKSFTHIAYIGGPPTCFVVPVSSPFKTFDDFLRTAKTKSVTYQTGGVGTVGHLLAEYVMRKGGLQLIHVPYNGPMMTDLISGVVDISSLALSTAVGQVEGGKLRVLAIGSESRLSDFPNIPTLKEYGFDISALSWLALSAPAGLPDKTVEALNREITKVMARDDVKPLLRQEVVEPINMTPQQVSAAFEREIARWRPIVEESGVRQK
jgi:tripartite-type tricarboxylate transporter receptor subunit TctC